MFFIFSLILCVGCLPENKVYLSNHPLVLNIYNWSSYIDPEILQEFEKRYQVKISYETFDTNDELYKKLHQANTKYDLVFPSDYMVSILAKEGYLQPINLTKIVNLKHINPKFLNQDFDINNQYSLPYQWGTMGIGYNIEKIGKIKTWSEIFNSHSKNKIALVNESRSMLGVILIYLGYNPNTSNSDEIAQAKNFLIRQKDLIESFSEKGEILLNQGIVALAVAWNGDILKYQTKNPNLDYVIPQEGSLIWIDNITLLKTSPHKALAEKFINFVFEPEISAKIANHTKYGSPNQTSVNKKLINLEDLNNPGIYPSPEIFNRLTYLKDVGEATKLYDQAWQEVLIKVGKL